MDHKEYCRQYYLKNKDKIKAKQAQWQLDHKEERKVYRQKIRLKCLQAYSTEVTFCACCNDSTIEFLSIDHINGGGNKQRQEMKTGGGNMYNWLIKNNFPEGFQILCHNCNMAKGFYGKCPHIK